jgi:hypothetical protein
MYQRFQVTTTNATTDIVAKDSVTARTKLQHDHRFGHDVWLDTTLVKAIENLPDWNEPLKHIPFGGFQRTSIF